MAGGRKVAEVLSFVHRSGEELLLPVTRVIGARSGPRFGVSAGMHAGEFAGIRAAIRLWREIDPERLSGELLILPLLSTRAFFARSSQLSPVDEHEVHGQAPGRPQGSYSEFQVDCVFELLRTVDFHVDLHGGEYVQALDPWISVPDPLDERLRRETWRLARSFPVAYLDPRPLATEAPVTAGASGEPDRAETSVAIAPGLPVALLDAGIPNIWTEIGRNGLQDPFDTDLQLRGLVNALRRLGMLDGEPDPVPSQLVVGPRHWRPLATATGYWRPFVRAGDRVQEGQRIGELRDLTGRAVERYVSPFAGIIQYVYTSPAINAERVPHGYTWHQGLFGLVEVRPEASSDPRLALGL